MNYAPNTIHWRKGDVVLHDADAKEPKMLMRVEGYTRDGLVKTKYCYLAPTRVIFTNPVDVLHDPNQWGIQRQWADQDLYNVQDNWEAVRWWNNAFGTIAVTLLGEDGHGRSAQTVSPAYMDAAGWAKIRVAPGCEWLLKFVKRNTYVPASPRMVVK